MAKSRARKRATAKKAAARKASGAQKAAGIQKHEGARQAGAPEAPARTSVGAPPTATGTTGSRRAPDAAPAEAEGSGSGTATQVAERRKTGQRPPRPERPAKAATRAAPPPAPGALAWVVTVGAVLLGVVALNNELNPYFGPRAAVLLVLAALGLPVLALRAWRSRLAWGARAAVAFLAVAAVAAALSPAPWVGFFGVDEVGTGWIFFVALAALWALGTDLGEAGAELLGRGLLLLALLTGGAIVLEVGGQGWSALGTFVTHFPGLQFTRGQPTGFAPNAVFAAQLLIGGLALLAWRSERSNPVAWWVMTAGLGAATYLSSERYGLLLIAGLAVWVLVVRRARAAAWFVAATGGGLLVGLAFQKLVQSGSSAHFRLVAAEGGNGTVGPRMREWTAALHAVAARPVVGIGPGQSAVAIVPYRPVPSLLRDGLFPDAHNFLVEVAVTTGLLGLGLFLAWLVPGLRHARGALLLYALVVLAGGLIEPLNITTTSLAFLALGAAAVGAVRAPPGASSGAPVPLPGWTVTAATAARVVLVLVALFAGITLMVGNTELHDGIVNSDSNALAAASRHLPMWSDAANALSDLANTDARSHPSANLVKVAVAWNHVAIAREPQDASAWARLGFNLQELGNLRAAEAAVNRSLALDPTIGTTYTTKALVLLRLDGVDAALHWAEGARRAGDVGAGFDPIIHCLQAHQGTTEARDQVAAACFGHVPAS